MNTLEMMQIKIECYKLAQKYTSSIETLVEEGNKIFEEITGLITVTKKDPC